MSLETNFLLFAVVPPGLEKIAAQEISPWVSKFKVYPGGIEFRGSWDLLYKTNLWLRTINRILVRIARFKALHEKEIPSRTARYPWELYLSPDQGIRIRVTSKKSRLYHKKLLAQKILEGIETRLGRKFALPCSDSPLLIVRIFKDQCVISIDSSGQDLFKRGYKIGSGPAPLRENLAAAFLQASGWIPELPVLDPFCGTGTIAIEAAMVMAHMAPGLKRSFAFERWKNFRKDQWQEIKNEALKSYKEPPRPKILARDWSPKALEAAQKNAKFMGLEGWIIFEQEDIRYFSLPPFKKGWVLSNPPYGKRLSSLSQLKNLYRTWGKILKKSLPHWKYAFLSPYKNFPQMTKLPLKEIGNFPHGGLRVKIFSHAF